MKVILIAAALAPLTLSPVNSAPLSDGEFARADDVSKIFIAVGAFAAAHGTCGAPILDKAAHVILDVPVTNQYYNQHRQEVAASMQIGADTFNKELAEQGKSAPARPRLEFRPFSTIAGHSTDCTMRSGVRSSGDLHAPGPGWPSYGRSDRESGTP